MAQNPDSPRVIRVGSAVDDSLSLRAAALVADASRAMWVDDTALALPHIAQLLVAEGLASRAVLEITGDDHALHGEARSATAHGTSGAISVPIVGGQGAIGTIAVDLPPQSAAAPDRVTALLKQLALFIGPAVAAHRARAGERLRLTDENRRLRSRLHGRHEVTSIIGSSEATRQVCELLSRAAPTSTPVLLEGEAGTGKAFLARMLHHSSPWAPKPFIEYSCSRAASGHVEADLIELLRARSGTLFLDDVHLLEPPAQAEVMRVLQQREFAPSPSTPLGPQVRIIATSEISLAGAVSDDGFRADLFHRLSGFVIAVPCLRDRSDDIPLLADYFLARFACDHGKPARRLAAGALDTLRRYPWPGHVRELANVIERAVLLSDDEVIHRHHLSPAIHAADGGSQRAPCNLSESLDAYEKDLLLDALQAACGVRSRAARLLQTTDRIFNYKVRKHAIDCRRFKP